ncbi:MAG: hypothetical protein OEN48_18115 [Betaproteobacteria bacterium]|nr:hypothetical protein [Betaproteobacteria bacterium]
MERTQRASRRRSTEGGRATNKVTFTGAPIATRPRKRGESSKPGGGLWLLKWALVVTLLAVLLLLTLPGLGLG